MEKSIKMTIEKKHELKLDKWLKTLTVDSEFLGLQGISHKDSFYKIYARQNPESKIWWMFDTKASISHNDPTRYQTKLSREKNQDEISGRLENLVKYKIHPGKAWK